MYLVAIFTFIALSSTFSASASCVHNTQLHPRSLEKGGKSVKLPNFGYAGNVGPTNWQAIDAENAECAVGLNQSPIDIKASNTTRTKPGDVKMEIPAGQNMTFENLGTNVEVLVEGTTMVGQKKFKLKQFHYHTPSEHRIDGEYFPVEVHMVHEAEDNPKDIAVVGMLFQLTADSAISSNSSSAIFSNVLSSISAIPQPGALTELPPSPNLDFTPLMSAIPSMSFFTYTGSLTTPPCSEGVTFLMATEPLSMGVETFNSMKKVVKFNSRFAQNDLGEQNLLQASRVGLESVEAKQWNVMEGVDVVPMALPAKAGVDAEKKVMLVVHSPRAFRA